MVSSVITFGNKSSWIDPTLVSNMDDMKKEMKKDNDIIIIVDGRERIGKSVFAQQVGWYMSNGQLSLADICFTAKEFQERVKNCTQGSTIIFDECYLGMASLDAMQQYNRMLLKMLVTCGQKNLCLILVLPSFFDLIKYVPLHRADVLLHCFKHKNERGHFAFYTANQMKNLYIMGKKFYSYYRPKPTFHSKFTKFYAVNEEAYRKKKLESLNDFLKEKEGHEVGPRKEMLYRAILIAKKNSGLSIEALAKETNMSSRTVYAAITWGKQNGLVNK